MSYGRDRVVIPVQIPIGTSLSNEVVVGSLRIIGIQMPAGWDAAGIAFQALIREPSALPKVPVYGNVVDAAGAAVNVTGAGVAADGYVSIADITSIIGLGRIKVRSGTNAIPVNQTATRDFFLVCIGD